MMGSADALGGSLDVQPNAERPTVEGVPECYYLVLYRGLETPCVTTDVPLSVTTLGALPHDADGIRARFHDAAESFIDAWFSAQQQEGA